MSDGSGLAGSQLSLWLKSQKSQRVIGGPEKGRLPFNLSSKTKFPGRRQAGPLELQGVSSSS